MCGNVIALSIQSLLYTDNNNLTPRQRFNSNNISTVLVSTVSNIALLSPEFPAHLIRGAAQELIEIITEMLTAGLFSNIPLWFYRSSNVKNRSYIKGV